MKPREPRRKVMIRARMRSGAVWGDINILDISSRGMLIQADSAPSRGAYLEVRRGRHAIIARVVWTNDRRFGVWTQDRLSVEAVIREPDLSGPEARDGRCESPPLERRAPDRRRLGDRHEQSRHAGRAFEFLCLAAAGAALAMLAFAFVEQTLAAPLSQVTAALAPG